MHKALVKKIKQSERDLEFYTALSNAEKINELKEYIRSLKLILKTYKKPRNIK